MKIKWYGHSTFVITTSGGVRICTDPFVKGCYDDALTYRPVAERCDVVLQSHDHPDHAGGAALAGSPVIVKGAGTHKVKDIEFTGVATWHDDRGGRERGPNTLFYFEADGLRVCFAGDLGHVLTAEQAKVVAPVDILLVPVGGYFTIDAAHAAQIAEQLKTKLVLPMHYKTPACGFPIAPVDDFLRGKANVIRVGAAEVDVTAELLAAPGVVVLDYVK